MQIEVVGTIKLRTLQKEGLNDEELPRWWLTSKAYAVETILVLVCLSVYAPLMYLV
jgi:hypothetical protein